MSTNAKRDGIINIALLAAIVLIWAALLVGMWVGRKPAAVAAPAPTSPAAANPAPEQERAPTPAPARSAPANPPSPAPNQILDG